ncbi:hypothetical protein LJC55_01975 [Eubacteriales bacterium OttesenSCG-928-N14]|nr:hypothetical protein [Eubacteriales bacterium OttesenSCG-928-N14]
MENKCYQLTQEQKACRHHSHFGMDMFSRNPKLINCKHCGAPLYYDFAKAQGQTIALALSVLACMLGVSIFLGFFMPNYTYGLLAILFAFWLVFVVLAFVKAAQNPVAIVWQGTTDGVLGVYVPGLALFTSEQAKEQQDYDNAIWLRYFSDDSRMPNSPKVDGSGRQNLMRLKKLWSRGFLVRSLIDSSHNMQGRQVQITGIVTDARHGLYDKYPYEFVYVQSCYINDEQTVRVDYSVPAYDFASDNPLG